MWQKVLKPYLESGEIHVIGVVQEQHPDRTQLYAQWRQLRWHIYVDSLNTLGVAVVPKIICLDESGIVRHTRMTPDRVVKEFIEKDYPSAGVSRMFARAPLPNPSEVRTLATKKKNSRGWRLAGDAFFLHGGQAGLTKAIEAYEKSIWRDDTDGRPRFSLGVAYRRRSESSMRKPGDAQAAVRHWGEALALNPNQYIWRRRIQQYGPPLDKPYNFYFWVKQARKDILARGETPVKLHGEPRGSEIAPPVRKVSGKNAVMPQPIDSNQRILRDHDRFIEISPTVAPWHLQPGQRARVRVEFRSRKPRLPWWNNEAEELRLWLDLPEGVTLGEGKLTYPNPKKPETRERRALEFELVVAKSAPKGVVEIPAYSLYYICENKGGRCRLIRQDVPLSLSIDPDAPTLR